MATEILCPPEMITGPNMLAIPVRNAFTFPSGTQVEAGEILVFDMDKCPRHGDLVLLIPEEGEPLLRECYLQPHAEDDRARWIMGVLLNDQETGVMIKLGQFAQVGVMTGRVPLGIFPTEIAA